MDENLLALRFKGISKNLWKPILWTGFDFYDCIWWIIDLWLHWIVDVVHVILQEGQEDRYKRMPSSELLASIARQTGTGDTMKLANQLGFSMQEMIDIETRHQYDRATQAGIIAYIFKT